MLPYTETGDKHYGVSMENYQRCRQKEPPHLADVLYLEMVPLRLAPLDQHPHRPKGTLGGGHNPVN